MLNPSEKKLCLYWYDDPDTSDDWLTGSLYKRTAWKIVPRGRGWRIAADHPCHNCKVDVTWKGAGMKWKFLYAGDDQNITFDLTPAVIE